MAPKIGIFRAEVISIDHFAATGKIQVRAFGIHVEDMWIEAEILTPFGGSPNLGIQCLPPVGSHGLIMFEGGSGSHPVWLGGLMRVWGKEFEEGWGNPVEGTDPTDFIIKTQHFKVDDREIDTDSNKVENILKMNEEE